MKEYKPRIADRMLERRLKGAAAVLIEGAKWCGKTTTATQQAATVLYLDDPAQVKQNMKLADIDPGALLDGKPPVLIDEWQLAPKLWDAIRFESDRRSERGQFILTGSAVPANTDSISHSGVGRFAWLTMRPMSLFESGDSSGEVSLSELFSGNYKVRGNNSLNLEDIAWLICRGGWPMSCETGLDKDVALDQAKYYYEAVVRSDISRVDNVRRSADLASRIMQSYARLQGAQAPISTITADISVNAKTECTDKTIASYVEALTKIFVIEDSKAWNPNMRSKTAIRTSDTRYFTDPSIATAALGIGPSDLINDLSTMGLVFETLCIRDLRVYADAIDGQIYHFRDKNGLECDAVIHLRNGKYGLIEVKLGGDKLIDEGVANLLKLKSKLDTDRMNEPSFMMILTATGKFAYRRDDGICIVPIACLKN